MHASSLAGKVVVVVVGADEPARSVALALAARGVRVVLAGPDERALGEMVGEIAFGGGKARHVVGAGARGVAAALARGREVFVGVDDVVVCGGMADEALVAAAAGARVVAVGVADSVEGVVRVELGGEESPESVAAKVVLLCEDEEIGGVAAREA